MKEIFDWLREQITTHLEQCIELRENSLDKFTEIGYGHRIDVYNRTLRYINEAEAEWEADCCEWKHARSFVNCFCKCNGIMVEHDLAIGFEFCPYCGKPIRISEVE